MNATYGYTVFTVHILTDPLILIGRLFTVDINMQEYSYKYTRLYEMQNKYNKV